MGDFEVDIERDMACSPGAPGGRQPWLPRRGAGLPGQRRFRGRLDRSAVGHRLRVQVSSGAHPRFARNLGSGEPLPTATTMIV